MGKFRASTKAISSISVLTAAQSKISNSFDHKKIRKFLGHPEVVRCMISIDDGEYIVSSVIGEKYITVWRIDGIEKQSANRVLGYF